MSVGVERVTPQDCEAEMSVLGAMILGAPPEKAAEIIKAEDFYRPANGCIFNAMLSIQRAGEAVDIVSLKAKLESKGMLERVGGIGYLLQLGEFVPTTANIKHYCRIVKDKSLLRAAILAVEEARGLLYGSADPAEVGRVLAGAGSALLVGERSKGRGMMAGRDVAMGVLTEGMEVELGYRPASVRFHTGLKSFDHMLGGGLEPKTLTAIMARPSMGKTTGAVRLVRGLRQQGWRVDIHSLEMSREQIVNQMIGQQTNLSSRCFGPQGMTEGEQVRYTRVIDSGLLDELWIDDACGPTPDMLEARIRQGVAERGTEVVVIDHMGLIKVEGYGGGGKEVGWYSATLKKLKDLAKELSIAIVILVQLNRNVEHRDDKRPRMSDAREAGTLEEDCDVIIGYYRPKYYEPKESGLVLVTKDDWDEMEWLYLKNRMGPTGTVKLRFLPLYRNIEDNPEGDIF